MASDFQNRFPVVNRERGTVSASAPKRTGPPAPPDQKTQDFLKLALSRYRTSADAENLLRREQETDQLFAASDQWPDGIKNDRILDGRPCLTINRIPAFKRQITNQQRAAKPSIQVNPVDSQRDTKTAEVYQGIIRHIEIASAADVAYDTACDHQVTIGRGYIRVVVEWDDLDPWQQRIRIVRVKNPFLVYFDPSCQEHDYSDARFAFVIEDIPREEFRSRYGKDALDGSQPWDAAMDRTADWMPEGKVRVAEYFYVETSEEDISLLSNGEEFPTASLQSEDMQAFLADTGVKVVRKRTVERKQVKWAKITATSILEEKDWPGKWIPIVPVLGDEYDINGKVDLRGMVRDARDPQRMYNYWVTAETEAIALAPKSPVVAAEGQIEDYETDWKMANRRNIPVLKYKPKTFGGELVPPPARQVLEPPILAIATAIKQSDNDYKAVVGLYDASLGERGPEESAKAILSRQRQGELGNSHWVDNLLRSLRCLGRQLVDLIPRVYDVPRVMRIIGADNQPQTVMVHAGQQEGVPPADSDAIEGIQGIYDLSAGRYDVTCTVGPTYQSRRQEAVQAMTAFIQAFPQSAPVIGDVMAENMDWPGASTISKRLRKMVPPGVLDEGGEPNADQLKAQMGQMQMQMQAVMAEYQQLQQEHQAQVVQAQSREKIAAMQEQTKIALAAHEAESDQAAALLKAQQDKLKVVVDRETKLTQAKARLTEAAGWAQHEATESEKQRGHELVLQTREHVYDLQEQHADHQDTMQEKRVDVLHDRATQQTQLEHQTQETKVKTTADLQKAKMAKAAKSKPAAKKAKKT